MKQLAQEHRTGLRIELRSTSGTKPSILLHLYALFLCDYGFAGHFCGLFGSR